jgi:hypothetical protein
MSMLHNMESLFVFRKCPVNSRIHMDVTRFFFLITSFMHSTFGIFLHVTLIRDMLTLFLYQLQFNVTFFNFKS